MRSVANVKASYSRVVAEYICRRMAVMYTLGQKTYCCYGASLLTSVCLSVTLVIRVNGSVVVDMKFYIRIYRFSAVTVGSTSTRY